MSKLKSADKIAPPHVWSWYSVELDQGWCAAVYDILSNIMSAPEIIFTASIAGLTASLLRDIYGFVSHTLPNLLRQAKQAKIKEDPLKPDFAVMAMVLKDMQSLGLVGPLEGEKRAVAGNPHAEDRDITTEKLAV